MTTSEPPNNTQPIYSPETIVLKSVPRPVFDVQEARLKKGDAIHFFQGVSPKVESLWHSGCIVSRGCLDWPKRMQVHQLSLSLGWEGDYQFNPEHFSVDFRVGEQSIYSNVLAMMSGRKYDAHHAMATHDFYEAVFIPSVQNFRVAISYFGEQEISASLGCSLSGVLLLPN